MRIKFIKAFRLLTKEQILVFSIYFINKGLQPVQANSWSLRALMPASSQEPPRRSHDCRRSLLLAETGSLTTFLPLSGFLSNFSPHCYRTPRLSSQPIQQSLDTSLPKSNLAKVLSTLFPGIPRETKCFTTAHLPKHWSEYAVKSNGLAQLFQGKVFHDWSTWHLGKNKIASCCLGTLELKDNYYQPKRFEK